MKIRNESVKFMLNNRCMYVKPLIVLFLLEFERYQECVFQVVAEYTCCE